MLSCQTKTSSYICIISSRSWIKIDEHNWFMWTQNSPGRAPNEAIHQGTKEGSQEKAQERLPKKGTRLKRGGDYKFEDFWMPLPYWPSLSRMGGASYSSALSSSKRLEILFLALGGFDYCFRKAKLFCIVQVVYYFGSHWVLFKNPSSSERLE